MDGGTIAWHGVEPGAADWSEESRLVAWTLADGAGGGLYIAFNASHRPTTLELPHWHGRSWQLVSDTGKARTPPAYESCKPVELDCLRSGCEQSIEGIIMPM